MPRPTPRIICPYVDSRFHCLILCLAFGLVFCPSGPLPTAFAQAAQPELTWTELPSLPNALGVAGPFAGVHGDALLVAGGANFPKPVWDNDKSWHDEIYVLTKDDEKFQWRQAGRLSRPTAYGAAVSTRHGVLCMGGNNAEQIFSQVYLLRWDAQRVTQIDLPPLPHPCAYGAAARIGDAVFVAGGQSGLGLDSAMNQLWMLDLGDWDSGKESGKKANLRWQAVSRCPWTNRAFNLTIAQTRAGEERLYVMGGRRQDGEQVTFLKDAWEFTLSTRSWRRCADAPYNVAAGIGAACSQNRIAVLGGANGELFLQADALRDKHPGFPKQSLLYDVERNQWTAGGDTPANHVTTIAVRWGDGIIVPSGEIRPRVRSPKVFRVTASAP